MSGADWIFKLGEEEIRVASVADLREAARAKRIVPGTYVFHPFRQEWVYAREIEELGAIFAPVAPSSQLRAGDMICINCGHVGRPKTTVQGSGCVELVLWLLLIIPGVIYSVWRLSSKEPTCPKCGGRNSMIPANSPRARELLTSRPPTR